MSSLTDTPHRLRVRPGALVIPDDAGQLARIAVGTRIVRAAGHGAVQVLRLLDGTRTLEQMQAELADDLNETEVVDAVRSLQLFGLVETMNGATHPGENGNGTHDSSEEPTPEMRAFNDLGYDGATLASILSKGRVAVIGSGQVAEAVAAAVLRHGVGSAETVALERPADPARVDVHLPQADLYLVAPDPFDPAFLVWFNRVALRYNVAWLPVYVAGFSVRLGPFVLPYETACWTCYERRIESNMLYYDDHVAMRTAMRDGARVPTSDNLVPGIMDLAAGLAALEVVRFLASRASLMEPVLFGKTLEYAFLSMKGTTHTVLKLPRCPACGVRARGFPSIRPWMQPNAESTSPSLQ
jgi:bacteriocin biosynthesis cyclodehydratase domain-containing protein